MLQETRGQYGLLAGIECNGSILLDSIVRIVDWDLDFLHFSNYLPIIHRRVFSHDFIDAELSVA